MRLVRRWRLAGHLEYVRSSVDQIQVVLNWFEELRKVRSEKGEVRREK